MQQKRGREAWDNREDIGCTRVNNIPSVVKLLFIIGNVNQKLLDSQSLSNWVTGSMTKVTYVTGFHFRDNVGIHILNSVSDHAQLVILLPHAINGDGDVYEVIMDGQTGNIHAVSYHLLN